MAPRFVALMLGHKYTSLSQDNDWHTDDKTGSLSFDRPMPAKNSFWTVRNLLQLLTALTFGILLGVFVPKAAVQLVHEHHEHHHLDVDSLAPKIIEDEGISCGSSAQEARELGCHFDMMASTWLPDECWDKTLVDEMIQEGNWTWYTDQAHTNEVSQDVALSGDFYKLYPLYDFHIAHCLHLWRKLHLAVIHRLPIDEKLYDYGHTQHCTKLIMTYDPARPTVTRIAPGFPICRKFQYYEPVNGVVPELPPAPTG